MKVIDIMNKISKGEKIKDFTVDNGNVVFGVIDGLLVSKTNKNIVEWRISDKWLECEVQFVNENDEEDLTEYIKNFMHDILKKF